MSVEGIADEEEEDDNGISDISPEPSPRDSKDAIKRSASVDVIATKQLVFK
jgi:hypothetical protein